MPRLLRRPRHRGDQHRGRRSARPRSGGSAGDSAYRRLSECRHDQRGRRRRAGPRGRRPGRRAERGRVARRQASGTRGDDLADPRRAGCGPRGMRAGRVRHSVRVPVHRRQPHRGPDRPNPRRGRRCRHGCHPARQARRRDRNRDGLQRRQAEAARGAWTRPSDQLRERELRRAHQPADRRTRR